MPDLVLNVWCYVALGWCADVSPASDGASLTIHDLFSYVGVSIRRGELNAEWVFQTLWKSPCFLINTYAELGHVCNYLGRAYAARGNLETEKLLYTNFHALPLSSLNAGDHQTQTKCLAAVLEGCRQHFSAGESNLVCEGARAIREITTSGAPASQNETI